MNWTEAHIMGDLEALEQGEVHLDVLTDEPYVIEAKRQDETAWAYTRADVEAAVKRALEAAAAEAAGEVAAHGCAEFAPFMRRRIRALDPAQFIDGDKT